MRFSVSNHYLLWSVILSNLWEGDSTVVLLYALLKTTLALSKAWNGTYIGSNYLLLLNNINGMLRDTPYSNSVSIIQSSGTGKSRMVHELSNLVFTLPFNLRPQSENKGYSLL
jgi:hypothetical protein